MATFNADSNTKLNRNLSSSFGKEAEAGLTTQYVFIPCTVRKERIISDDTEDFMEN
jgi:hypothetical protein